MLTRRAPACIHTRSPPRSSLFSARLRTHESTQHTQTFTARAFNWRGWRVGERVCRVSVCHAAARSAALAPPSDVREDRRTSSSKLDRRNLFLLIQKRVDTPFFSTLNSHVRSDARRRNTMRVRHDTLVAVDRGQGRSKGRVAWCWCWRAAAGWWFCGVSSFTSAAQAGFWRCD